LGNHRAALATLVQGLRDGTSAEAYCTLGGDVVPAKTAQFIGEQYGLQLWASTLFTLPIATTKPTASKLSPVENQKTVNEDLKKELLRILLEVYMSDG
jgi:vacuolar protein sorting-associated protein 3